ncbi:unnamed protein product, partial [Closterium sp. NIES-53]
VGGEGVGGEKGGEGERESGRKRKLEEEEEAEREKEKERERERKTASTLLHLRGMAVAHPMLVVPLLPMLAAQLKDLIPLVTCSSQSLKSAAVNAFSSALVLLSALQPSLLALYNRSPSATTTTTTTTTVSTTAAAATASSSRSSSSDVLAVVVQPYLDLLLTLKLRDKPTVVRLVAQLSDFLLRCCSHSAAADMHVGMNGAMHAQAHMASHGAMRADTQTDTHPSQQAGSHLRSLELVRAHRGGALAHAAKHFGKVKKLKLLLATLDAGGKLSVEGEGAGEEGNQSLGKWLDLRARLVSVLQGSASGAWVGDEWWLSGDDATAAAGAAAGIAAAQAAGEGAHVEAVMGVLQEVESLAAQQPARLSLLQQPLCLTLLCCPLPHSPSLPPSLAAAGGGVEGRVDGGMVVDMVLRLLERMLLHAYSACNLSLVASSLLHLLHSLSLHPQPPILTLLSSYMPRLLCLLPDHRQQLLDALMHLPPHYTLPPPPPVGMGFAMGFRSTPPHSHETPPEPGRPSTSSSTPLRDSDDPLLCTVRSLVAMEL